MSERRWLQSDENGEFLIPWFPDEPELGVADAEVLAEMDAGRIWTCVERLTWSVRARGCHGHSRCGWAWVVWEKEDGDG